LRLHLLLALTLTLVCCTTTQHAVQQPPPSPPPPGWDTYQRISTTLSNCGASIDYDTLWQVYREIRQAQEPIPRLNELLATLMAKRNDNPRVDNMILIATALIMGKSTYAIEDAANLFEAILNQDERLNTWVLTYVGDALGNYPVDLPEGDQLADLLDQKVQVELKKSSHTREFFGYHFLPPPKGDYIRTYIAGIQDQRIRVWERNCYYILLNSKLSEAQIESALRRLRADSAPDTEEKTTRPLKYLIQHFNQFFETTERIVITDPRIGS
jgi:hypothetical protein